MAVYKVPQDVEADDKLIGPFSFRQFIYLLIVGGAITLGWGLSRLFLPLAIIPLPVVIFFGALALPLRKDQPMEIYLAAVVSFYLKPRKRLWQPDGITSLVEVTAPKTVEALRTKGFDENEAERRLSYLAGIVDSQGWAVRGVADQSHNSPMNTDVFFDAQRTEDVLDDDNTLSKNFDQMIQQNKNNQRKQMIAKMHETAMPGPQFEEQHFDRPAVQQGSAALQPGVADFIGDTSSMHFNPYPDNIHQTVIQPLSEQRRMAEDEQKAREEERQRLWQEQQRAAIEAQKQAVLQQQTQQVSTPTPSTQPQYQPQVQAMPAVEFTATPVATAPQPMEFYQESYSAPAPEPAYAPPIETTPVNIPPATSVEPPSPDTIDLAINHHDLSVEAISHEANRLREKREQPANEEEVFISVR